MKTPDYLSYEKYKKKKDSNPNKRLLIFITTFFVTLLLFSMTAKLMSPDVDVTIGDESEAEPKETGLGVKRFIDDRLKMIQMEDSSAGVSVQNKNRNMEAEQNSTQETNIIDEEVQFAEEKMNLPTKKDKNIKATEDTEVMPLYTSPPRPSKKDLATPFESPKVSKVYVGRYYTLEQAKVAQEILMDSGINVSPFVKDIGGVYTLQLGSYSNKAKADELAAELRKNGFPTRVVQE